MRARKVYPIEKSPLYRIRSKSKLAELLKIEPKELNKIVSKPLWHVWPRREKDKIRVIEEPKWPLRKIHNHLQSLLSRIETPSYLFSGKKKVSAVSNAKAHLDGRYFFISDVEHFYPNCKREYVFRFFLDKLKISEDIGWLLTDLICFDGHIPTGSPLSGSLAYWANADIFDSISAYAVSKGYKFTLYVDDMTISSPTIIPKDFHLFITSMLKKVGHNLKKKKTRYIPKNSHKKITGVIISPDNRLLTPNKIQKSVHEKIISSRKFQERDETVVRKTLGELRYIRQITPNAFEDLYSKLRDSEKDMNAQKRNFAPKKKKRAA